MVNGKRVLGKWGSKGILVCCRVFCITCLLHHILGWTPYKSPTSQTGLARMIGAEEEKRGKDKKEGLEVNSREDKGIMKQNEITIKY